ncbi:hypothetical protein DFJ58DRAFT_850331 [Suillus subalutaceus]|uniref:uncharacterized protein n=1 Tax=Suillus subalutaceus TaxID=48586 RepID=UPI001B88696F|nr:uncharacterized protein DFJ58DRAFT_850331 [Suillus subalutaceus]KAG1817417.1 hypothetical protein DFJ58DRAFT_850331 [Suillus subalutaceus]
MATQLVCASAFIRSITSAVDRLTCRAPAYLEFLHPVLVPPASQSNSHLSKHVALSTTPQPQNSWAKTQTFLIKQSSRHRDDSTRYGSGTNYCHERQPKQQIYDIEASNLVADCAWTANTDEVLQRHVASAGHWGRPVRDGEAGVNERRSMEFYLAVNASKSMHQRRCASSSQLRKAQIPTHGYAIRSVIAAIYLRGSAWTWPCSIFTGVEIPAMFQQRVGIDFIQQSTMCLSASKRTADAVLTPTKASKRMRLRLTSPEETSMDARCNCRRSSENECSMREHAYALLETLERLEFHVEYLEADRLRDREELEDTRIKHCQEIEELQSNHNEELDRFRERIHALEDETRYQQAMLGVLNAEVERLEAETDLKRTEIEGYISHGVEDGMARRKTLAFMRDTIVKMFDNANL